MWPGGRPATSRVTPLPMSAHAVRSGSYVRRISTVRDLMVSREWEAVQTKQGGIPLVLCPCSRVRRLRSVLAPFTKARPLSVIDQMGNLEPGAVNYFEYKANTTNCTNGVFCPNPGNWNCCLDGQGVREITFHNHATIPTVAAELSTYYEEGNYTIPNLTSGSLTSTTTLPRSTFASTTSTITSATPLLRASSAQSTASATSEPTPASTTANSLSSGGKAGVAIAAGGCAGIIGVLLYLLRQSRKKRLMQPGFETKGLRYEVSEMPGHDARTEMDAVEGRFPQESRPGGIKELMGQEESDRRAEMPT